MTAEEYKERTNIWRCIPVILYPSHVAVTLFKLWIFMLPKATSISGQRLGPWDFPLWPLSSWVSRCALFFYQHSGSNPAKPQLCPDIAVFGLVLSTLALAGKAPGCCWCGVATVIVSPHLTRLIPLNFITDCMGLIVVQCWQPSKYPSNRLGLSVCPKEQGEDGGQ